MRGPSVSSPTPRRSNAWLTDYGVARNREEKGWEVERHYYGMRKSRAWREKGAYHIALQIVANLIADIANLLRLVCEQRHDRSLTSFQIQAERRKIIGLILEREGRVQAPPVGRGPPDSLILITRP